MEADDQEKTLAKGKRRYGVLIAVFSAIGLVIFVSIFSVVLIINLLSPTKPKEAFLYYPGGEMVLAGATKDDLEKALKISKEWAKTYVREAFRGAAREDGDFSEARERVIEAAYPIGQMIDGGNIVAFANGTRCLILEAHFSTCKVEITEGVGKGQTYWVYKNCVEYVK